MKAIIAGIVVLVMAGDASACIRNPVGFSFEDKINNEFSYLVCLHNEQNDVLRTQDEQIKLLLQALRQQEANIQQLTDEIEQLRQ